MDSTKKRMRMRNQDFGVRIFSIIVIALLFGMNLNLPFVYADSVSGPPAVANLNGEALSYNSVRINWSEYSQVPDFDIFRVSVNYGERVVDLVENEFVDTGLSPETTYRYEIYGIDNFGNEGEKRVVEVTTLPPDHSVPSIRDLRIIPSS
ncbi:MAG: hypothetical protein ACLFUO_03640, partial [Candidatus Woesearchaeota archaeon]